MRITVLFPTATEAARFVRAGVNCVVSGVGLTATAHVTSKLIFEQRPDWLILAGVAGMYPHAPLAIGEAVLVESEVEGDLGFFTPQGFTHLAHLPLDMAFERRHTVHCPHLPAASSLRRVRSVSLNAALAPFVNAQEAEIENMEGAAFFHVCRTEGVKFVELRTISNVVQPGHDDWDLDGSVRTLHTALHTLIDQLKVAN